MATLPNLPEDILIEIFCRSHTKSIGACRCLSKYWNSYLSSQEFIKTHFSRQDFDNQDALLLIDKLGSLHLIGPTITGDFNSENYKLQNPLSEINGLKNSWCKMVGSCDGLVLLIDEDDEMFLVNPIMQKQVKIPNPHLAASRYDCYCMQGFGYDSSNDDYKIVVLYIYEIANEYADAYIDVYSLKMGLWKNRFVSPYFHAPSLWSSTYNFAPYVNGAIHCLASCREYPFRSVIAAFDLAKEVFVEISPPPCIVEFEERVTSCLYVIGDDLCMAKECLTYNRTEIWILAEYGLSESWTKLIVEICYWNVYGMQPLYLIDNEDVLVTKRGDKIFAHNLITGNKKNLVFDGVSVAFSDGGAFVETLISPVL